DEPGLPAGGGGPKAAAAVPADARRLRDGRLPRRGRRAGPLRPGGGPRPRGAEGGGPGGADGSGGGAGPQRGRAAGAHGHAAGGAGTGNGTRMNTEKTDPHGSMHYP